MNLKFLSSSIMMCVGVIASFAFMTPCRVVADTLLKPGDRVVFYGDSITEQRMYTRYIQQYIDCRYPSLKVRFFNAGWSGDTAGGALNRLDRDVLVLKPTVVTLFFGMNDGGYQTVNPALTTQYVTNLEAIITKLQALNIKVIVFTPGSVDPDVNKKLGVCNYNDTLSGLAQAAIALAVKHNCPYVDVHDPMLAYQNAEKAKVPTYQLTGDGVHPDSTGHLLMASLMLAGFSVDPLPALGTFNAKRGTGNGLSLTSNQNGVLTLAETNPPVLPYWFEPANAATMEDSGFYKLAEQSVVVKGLAKGTYQLTVDGNQIGQYSNSDLTAGVYVPGTYSTAGQRLFDLINAKENLYFMNWRQLRLPFVDLPGTAAVVADLLDADDQLSSEISTIDSPTTPSTITVSLLPNGKNVALNRPYTASDPNQYNWGVAGLTDGSWDATAQHCFASGDKDSFPKTATIDLGASFKTTAVILGVPAFGATKTINVSVSTDGTNFTQVGTHVFDQNKEERYTYNFAPTDARYVELTYPDHYDDGAGYTNTFVFTEECEVYAGTN